MKNLYILCGAQGSGKSTFIQINGLADYTLNTNQLRIFLETPDNKIYPKHDEKMFKILYTLLDYRLAQNQTTFIDSICILTEHNILKLAAKYNYTITVIDFRRDNLKELLERNSTTQRGYRHVSEEVLINTFNKLLLQDISQFNTITPEQFSIQIEDPVELNKYKRILISGDWHDNYREVRKLLDGFNATEEDLIILLGDYFNRGGYPKEMRKLITELSLKDNVILLRGNHDSYCPNCIDYLYMRYNSQSYFISHAPQTNLPTQLTNGNWLLQSYCSNYSELPDIYEQWESNQPNVILIHGHSNYWNYPMHAKRNVYNLNSDTEFEGSINAAVLTHDGIDLLSIPAETSSTPKELYDIDNVLYYRHTDLTEQLCSVMLQEEHPYKLNLKTYADSMILAGDEVVIRGFDKIDYLEYIPNKLKKNLAFPLTVEIKHNGFVGYLSSYNDDFIMATRGNIDNSRVDMLKELLPVFKDSHSELLNAIKQHTLVFEVIHNEVTHIVDYNNDSFIYLLASVNNLTGQVNIKNNIRLTNFINKYGNVKILPQKRTSVSLTNMLEVIEFISMVKKSNEPVEGYVIRDQRGFGFKVDTSYYTNWKALKSKPYSLRQDEEAIK